MRGATRVLMTLAAATLAAALGATSSLAVTATTWTVHPGGTSSGSISFLGVQDTKTGGSFACTSSHLSVSFKSGSGLPGSGLGSVTSLTATGCQLGGAITFSQFPYVLSASSYSSGTTTGRITGIHGKVFGAGCEFVVDGTSATADNGSIAVSYSNSTGKLKYGSRNLHFYNVSGCFGIVGSGDRLSLKFSHPYKLSPRQTITSP